MHRLAPPEDGAELSRDQRRHLQVIDSLGRTPQGIVLLHHALVAYLEWPLWSEIVGMADRGMSSYHHDERVPVRVAADHPITRGLPDWEMTDETYVMRAAEPDQGNTILLTTPHDRSMRTLAWTRQHRESRVFCFQSGHDAQCWEHPSFRTVLQRGVPWCCGRL
jgi:type 1 glutamine amidotransferase